MYATEKTGRSIGNVMEWIVDFMRQEVNQRGEQGILRITHQKNDKKKLLEEQKIQQAADRVEEKRMKLISKKVLWVYQ